MEKKRKPPFTKEELDVMIKNCDEGVRKAAIKINNIILNGETQDGVPADVELERSANVLISHLQRKRHFISWYSYYTETEE